MKPNDACRYVLTLSPEQALVVEQACELYARLNIGQLETITEKLLDDYSASDYGLRRDAANSLLRAAAEISSAPNALERAGYTGPRGRLYLASVNFSA